MPTIADMKALPWLKILAAFLLVYVALSMFRFKVVSRPTLYGEQAVTMDRWTGREVDAAEFELE
jgi:hypothetical protein